MFAFSPLEWVALVLLSLIGLKFAWNVSNFLFTTFVGSWLGLNIDLRQYGPWAVVTGATSGIGKAYSLKLASLGINVVLISRSPSKLEASAQELKSINPFIQVRTVAVDFTGDKSIYKEIAVAIADLDIGILINNVGQCLGFCRPFAEIQDDRILDNLINCNVVSMARMTHLILPQMLNRQRGIILNIGSISGAFSTPLATMYAATKSFVDKFSRDLSAELSNSGVIVQTVLPGFVLTNMSMSSTKLNKTSWTVPTPEDYVNANLRTLGLESRTASYWYHKLYLSVCETACFMAPGLFNFVSARYLAAMKRNDLN